MSDDFFCLKLQRKDEEQLTTAYDLERRLLIIKSEKEIRELRKNICYRDKHIYDKILIELISISGMDDEKKLIKLL